MTSTEVEAAIATLSTSLAEFAQLVNRQMDEQTDLADRLARLESQAQEKDTIS